MSGTPSDEAEAQWHRHLQIATESPVVSRFAAMEVYDAEEKHSGIARTGWRVDGLIGFPSKAAADRYIL